MEIDQKWLQEFCSEIDRERAELFAKGISVFMNHHYPGTPNTKGAAEAAAENFSIFYNMADGSVVFMRGKTGIFCMHPAVPKTFVLHKFCEELSGGPANPV